MAKSIKKFLKSFTLIELIIVIAIMVILGAIIAPQYFKHVKNANIASDVEQAARISSAISAEIAENAVSGVVTAGFAVPTTGVGTWANVTAIVGVTGKVANSKVEKDSEFWYRIDSKGGVEVGVAESPATPTADHIISPMNSATTNQWD